MLVVRYLLSLLLTSLGLLCGVAIAYYTKQEIIDGKKYLKFTSNIIFMLLCVMLVAFDLIPLSKYIVLLAILGFYFISKELLWVALGALFFVASFDIIVFRVVSFMLFFLGILEGALADFKIGSVLRKMLYFLLTAVFGYIIWASLG